MAEKKDLNSWWSDSGPDSNWIETPNPTPNPSPNEKVKQAKNCPDIIARTIDYKYIIGKRLGSGGCADVYLCESKEDGKRYAFKIFKEDYVRASGGAPSNSLSDSCKSRVTREISALKKVKDPAVCSYKENGVYVDYESNVRYHYIVMDYAEGESLHDRLKREYPFRQISIKVPMQENIEIFKKIVHGVDVIHKKKIIHRDLKPENIMIGNDGSVKIVDFGLSKIIDQASITDIGTIIGTPLFMAPEQAMGAGKAEVDYRADYYALGNILFKLLTNEYPILNSRCVTETVRRVREEPVKNIKELVPDIPPDIEKLVNMLLAKDANDRPRDVKQIFSLLEPPPKKKELYFSMFGSFMRDKGNDKRWY